MKILVINTGSSSIKYELFDMGQSRVLASGLLEKIGEETSFLHHKRVTEQGLFVEKNEELWIPDHETGLRYIVDLLVDPSHGSIKEKSDIPAIGHRVVHGGEEFHTTIIIDDEVIRVIKENIHLAPLHNPSNLKGIEVAKIVFPDAVQVAVFDTAFHQTIPMKAFLYAIPLGLYEKVKIRRYGFHGTSHSYVAEQAANYLKKPLESLNLITIHLGNGASMAAIKRGKCVDTSMGMTPLEGLVMGTRSGDIDPALPFFLADQLGMNLKEIDNLLNKESGLKGICGTNDMREVIELKRQGDQKAKLALDIYCYRIKKYIGAYLAVLGSLDALVFTAGIGENSSEVRALSCKGLDRLGIRIDEEKNARKSEGIREISQPDSPIKILVIPTNEELKIALETVRALESMEKEV